MIYFLYSNYFPFFIGSTFAVLAILWSLQERYNILVFFRNSKAKRILIDFLLSLAVAIPVGFIIGNSTLRAERIQYASKIEDFKSNIIEKVKETDEIFAKEGYGSKFPRTIPYPLLLNEYDFVNYCEKYKHLHKDVQRIFSPRVARVCKKPFEILSHPHSSLFKIEKVDKDRIWLKNNIVYSKEHLSSLLASMEECSVRAFGECSYIFIPKP